MSYFVTTSEQKKILDSDKPLLNVGFEYTDKALHTVALKCLDHLSHLKKTILYMPYSEDREKFKNIVSEMGFENFILFVHPDDDISHERQFFQNAKEKTPPAFDILNFHLKKLKYSRILSQKNAYSDHKNQTILEDKTWREVLDMYCQLPPHSHARYLYNHLSHMAMSLSHPGPEITLPVIEKAQNLYSENMDFDAHHSSIIGVKESLLTIFHIDETLQFVHEALDNAKALRLRYHECQLEITEILRERDRLWTESICHAAEKIKVLVPVYNELKKQEKKETGLMGIFQTGEKESGKIEKTLSAFYRQIVTELQNKNMPLPENSEEYLRNTDHILDGIVRDVKAAHQKYKSSSREYLKHINTLNFQYPKLAELEKEMFQLFDQINTQSIYHQKWEANSISFIKQKESLDALIRQLDKTRISLIKNKSYLEWNQFMNDLDNYHQQLIRLLTQIPSEEWITAYLSYDYFSTLYRHSTDSNPESLYDVYTEYRELEIEKWNKEWHEKINLAMENFSRNAPSLYAYIFKNKASRELTSWRWVLSRHPEAVSNIFPVVVTDSCDISDIPSEAWDEFMIFNAPEVPAEALHISPSLTTFWKNGSEEHMDFYLRAPYKPEGHILSVPVSQRYSLARAIAKTLITLHERPRLYTLKNACLISYASPFIEKELLSALHHLGIKILPPSENLTEDLESVILDSTENVFVLTEDGYFVTPVQCELTEQEYILKNLQDTGCLLFHISTQKLFSDAKQTVDMLVADILHHIHKDRHN